MNKFRWANTVPVWLMWVAAVIFFAFGSFYAPGGGRAGELTAPESMLFALSAVHLFGGVILLVTILPGLHRSLADNDE